MKTLFFILMSFMMMLLMGTVYTWSVFRVEVESVYQVNALQSGLPYMTSLFFYALSMMLTGRILTEKTMRKIALVGGVFIGVGWLLASISASLLMLSIGYGLFIGVGVGMVYGVPIFIINRRYTTRSGLYSGIVLGGFGASPLITAPFVANLIAQSSLANAFFLMGIVSLVVLMSSSVIFNHKTQSEDLPDSISKPYDAKQFVLLYGMFFMATTIGLMIIGLSYRLGVVDYGYSARQVTIAMAVFALSNGLARPLFGYIMDKRGFVFGASLSVSLIMLAAMVALVNNGMHLSLFVMSIGLFWFNLGAWLSMIPTAIKVYFGTSNYAKRYGFMFTAYGFGAICGTLLSGVVLDILVETKYVYYTVLGTILIVGTLLYRFARTLIKT